MRRLLASFGIVAILSLTAVPFVAAMPVQAATKEELCKGANVGGAACDPGNATADDQQGAREADKALKDRIRTITNTILYIVGALSVVVLIYGGFRYVTSAGNSQNVTAAKETIIYAITGLVVAILAYAIVNFVISRLGG